MNPFSLKIVTPDGVKFDGEAESLLVRTGSGDTEILAGHTDYIASVGTGRIRILLSDHHIRLGAVSGGVLTVKGGAVSLVATSLEYADEIDLRRAECAKAAAEERLKEEKLSASEIELAKAKLARAISRINVASNK